VDPEKQRKQKLIRTWLILFILGMLYYCFVKTTGIGIPCFFHLFTGLKCPGCGISTMLMKLAEQDFAGAFAANRFLFVTAPFLIFELIYAAWLSWNAKKQPKWNSILLTVYAVCLVLFGIVRNLSGRGLL